MKNNNVKTVKVSAIPTLSTISAEYEAVTAAKKKYDEVKQGLVKQLAAAIADVPADAPVLNRDLARAAGLTPLHFASIINAQHQTGVHSTTVTVTRRFIEVDEDGNPIEGAAVRELRSELTGYYGKRDRNW